VIVIDGIQSGAPPGTLRKVARDQLAPTAAHPASGHSFGLADTLTLGQALQLLPPRLTLIAVELGCAENDDALSGEVRAALPAVLRCVEACIADEEICPGFPQPRDDGDAGAATRLGRPPSVCNDAQS
jgi:hydrogenase maturation protease